MHAKRILIAAMMAALMTTGSVAAQWLTHPTAGIPRLPDGKPNLAAPAPKHATGKPVLAGLWRPSPGMVGDIARNLKPGEVPYQPWAEALFKERRANSSKDDPPPTASSAECRDRTSSGTPSRSWKSPEWS